MTVESGGATTTAPSTGAPAASAPLDRPVPDTRDQAGELIQLLTPEGERIDHPNYPLELAAADLRDLYRDLVLVRRIDTEAI
ncbi:MAG TPA: pyruvate dehydrogenase (acetyl-transferring) E1 component subunit alpha, partial [Streptosporangiaceae bacterium]|nr:pyruvate dehydrogenase (acetyl-transferring) E1 component subunit alpha [Streptosporangiaceae bacterium]